MNRVRFILNEDTIDDDGLSDVSSQQTPKKNVQQRTGKYAQQNANRIQNKNNDKLAQKLSADKTKDYQDRYYDSKNDQERQTIVKEFLENKYKSNSKAWEVIEPLQSTIKSEIDDAGFGNNNPFFQFIDKAIVNRKIDIQPFQYNIIHNLTVDGKLESEDLMGTGSDGLEDIIFNKSLYKIQDDRDFTFLIQAYHWFRRDNKSLITSAKPVIGVDKKEVSIKDDYNDLKNDVDLKKLRNDIMFTKMGQQNGTLRSASDIEYDMQGLNAQTRRNIQNQKKNQWTNTQEKTIDNNYQRSNADRKNNEVWTNLTSLENLKKAFNKPNLGQDESERLLRDLVHYLNDKGIR